MLAKKVVAIKNVGRVRNSAAPGNPQLSKHTLILGANGYGKTTFCAVLRSLQSGDASLILGRRTLGIVDAPTVELLLDTTPSQFDGATWTAVHPAIAIFDGCSSPRMFIPAKSSRSTIRGNLIASSSEKME